MTLYGAPGNIQPLPTPDHSDGLSKENEDRLIAAIAILKATVTTDMESKTADEMVKVAIKMLEEVE